MPVKVRCTGCRKSLNAPDTARGKGVKCPHCGTKLRVPADSSAPAKAAGKTRSPRRKPAAVEAPSSHELLANLDLEDMEDKYSRVCPRCAAAVTAEDMDCPACGINLATGLLGTAARRKRALRGGPDPAEFYKKAWSDSWQFLRNNMSLARRTGLYWTVFATLFLGCLYMAVVFCERTPPRVFWGFLAFLCYLGLPGWYWFLTISVIKATTERRKTIKKLNFDFFLNVGLGFKAGIWPIVLILPFLWFPPAWLLPILAFPLAMIHMTMPYTYKAWLPWDMTKIFFKNIVPTLYWLLIALVVHLPLVAALAAVGWVFGGDLLQSLGGAVVKTTEWCLQLIGESPTSRGFMFGVFATAVASVFTVLTVGPLAFAMAFPAVFTMRANGLLAHYNKRNLDLVQETTANVPAGFWVRYLAFMVDNLIVTCFLGAVYAIIFGVIFFLVNIGIPLGTLMPLFFVYYVLCFLIPFLYFTKQESGPEQGTLGKKALGLIVTDVEGTGKPISMNTATGRFFGRILSALPLYIGFFMAGFTERKQTLHDRLSKTQVVWRGDDEATTR